MSQYVSTLHGLGLTMRAMVLSLACLLPSGLLATSTARSETAPPPSAGEEAETARTQEAATPSARDVLMLAAEWRANERQLANLNENYRRAVRDAEREAILAEHKRLVNDSRLVLARLRTTAQARFEAAPNEDPPITGILVSFVAQDLQRDRPDEAWRLGQLLTKHGSDSPQLLDLLGRVAYHRDDFRAAASFLEKAQESGSLSPEGERYLEDLDVAEELWQDELSRRAKEGEADDLPRVRLVTSKGDIVVELFENEAPQTVGNFIHLVSSGFYEGSPFHRVLGNFMVQGGSNSDDGLGGPGYEIYCECHRDDHRKHFRGSLSMAKKAEPHTGSSQFFLTFRRTARLDGMHTVFGRVLEGWDVLENIQRRDPSRPGQPEPDRILKAEVLRKRDHEYVPHKVNGGG